MSLKHKIRDLFATVFFITTSFQANADTTNIAVAANFTAAAKDIAAAFKEDSTHEAILSFGSTGKLYAQIANGAPFTVFLAADSKRPTRLEKEGFAIEGSRFTYASGKITLFSKDASLIDQDATILKHPDAFKRLAIANLKTAPYGTAAIETLQNIGAYEAVKDKIVQGDNIAQTYQFVATENAQLGFVALSQVINETGGSQWVVPAEYYRPIAQQAVLLTKGKDDPVARAFIAYLQSPRAQRIIQSYGYGLK